MSDRIFRLLERHQALDDRLRRLQTVRKNSPWGADPFEIARLKKHKLALKDRLTRSLMRTSPA